MMTLLAIALLAAIPLSAQSSLVRLKNASRPASQEFQVGDRFEVSITGLPNQPISVRTTRAGRTDWGPIVGSTDSTGKWSTAGHFEKSDFGDWGQVWTVGRRVASPGIQFAVNAPPCLPDGQSFSQFTGRSSTLTCLTADGQQTFATPSSSASFQTPDGRMISAESVEQTQDRYQMGVLQYLFTSQELLTTRVALQSSRGGRGDETAGLILKLIGVNALTTNEKRNVLAILRFAFEKPEEITPTARFPAQTYQLLQFLADFTEQDDLKREIAETVAYVQTK
jgi:hypothetical protein